MKRNIGLALAVTCLWGSLARADNALDLVTDHAAFTFATGDIDELKTNADRFAVEILGNQGGFGFKPSAIFDQAAQMLGVATGRKPNGAVALVLNPQFENLRGIDENLVVVIPIGDLDQLAVGAGFKKGDFQRDKMYETPKVGWGKFRCAHGDFLYIGQNKAAVEHVLKGKSIAPNLDPALVKRLGGAGLLLHVGIEKLPAKERQDALNDLERTWLPRFSTDREKEVAKAAAKALPELEHILGWLRYDKDSFQLSLAPVFQKGGKGTTELFDLFRHGDSQATFTGLPTGSVVAAHASVRNNGKGSAALSVLAHSFGQILFPRGTLTGDWTNFVNIFTEVTRKLDGARFALYQTTANEGTFSMVGILDSRDPDKFMADLRQLARLGHFQGLDLQDAKARATNLELIKQLVDALGSEDFQERESATIKLQLIGEPALETLRAARKDADLERVRRAERIIEWIATDVKERRQALLRPQELGNLKPSFVFLDKTEKLAGWDVHHVGIVFPGKADMQRAQLLAGLFGRDWQRVRLATQGKQIVVLVGSDVKLLEAALTNLKEGKPGLAATPAFQQPGVQAAHTRFLLSISKIVELATAADLKKESRPAAKMSGLEFQVGDHHVELNLRMPLADVKSLARLEDLMRGARR